MRQGIPTLSVVIPAYNEAGNVAELWRQLKSALAKLDYNWQVVVVDDGSTDNTFARLKQIQRRNKQLTLVRLRRRFGQTAALVAGFDHARGEIVVTLDADLQNDPKDIDKLLKELDK